VLGRVGRIGVGMTGNRALRDCGAGQGRRDRVRQSRVRTLGIAGQGR